MAGRKKSSEVVVQSIKGFGKDLSCAPGGDKTLVKFEVGKTYEQSGMIRACSNGFHACTLDAHPLSVFGYYPPATSRYCLVEQSGEIHTDDQVKIASAKITIGVELSLNDLILRAVEWVFARAKPSKGTTNSGYQGAATNSGDYGAATNSGDYGAATNSGYQGAATNSGTQGAATNSGTQGAATNSGDYGAASNSGDYGAATNSGDYGAATNSGDYGAASNSGEYGAATNSGYQGAAISHAYGGKVMCEGDGQALYCTEFNDKGEIASVACGITGKDGIKAGTWYACKAGKLVSA